MLISVARDLVVVENVGIVLIIGAYPISVICEDCLPLLLIGSSSTDQSIAGQERRIEHIF